MGVMVILPTTIFIMTAKSTTTAKLTTTALRMTTAVRQRIAELRREMADLWAAAIHPVALVINQGKTSVSAALMIALGRRLGVTVCKNPNDDSKVPAYTLVSFHWHLWRIVTYKIVQVDFQDTVITMRSMRITMGANDSDDLGSFEMADPSIMEKMIDTYRNVHRSPIPLGEFMDGGGTALRRMVRIMATPILAAILPALFFSLRIAGRAYAYCRFGI